MSLSQFLHTITLTHLFSSFLSYNSEFSEGTLIIYVMTLNLGPMLYTNRTSYLFSRKGKKMYMFPFNGNAKVTGGEEGK